jgi:hypothetical protein
MKKDEQQHPHAVLMERIYWESGDSAEYGVSGDCRAGFSGI